MHGKKWGETFFVKNVLLCFLLLLKFDGLFSEKDGRGTLFNWCGEHCWGVY
jgi:hypothetical protein